MTEWINGVMIWWTNETIDSVNQSLREPVIQWINESMHKQTCESLKQWMNEWLRGWESWWINESANQWIKAPLKWTNGCMNNHPMNQRFLESMHIIDWLSTNQWTSEGRGDGWTDEWWASYFSFWATSSLSHFFAQAPLLAATFLSSHWSGLLLIWAATYLAYLFSASFLELLQPNSSLRAAFPMRLNASSWNPT